VLVVTGSLIALVFLIQTVMAMFQRGAGWLEFWAWIGAGETAAWRLKWVAVPVLFVTLWFGRKLYRSIAQQPQRFCGLNYARRGLLASSTVAFLIALLIGITVPARLEQRRLAKEATIRAYWYTFEAAASEYRLKDHTYPADFKELRERIPDPDGTLAEALNNLDANGYKPSADVAAMSGEKSRTLRGAAVRNASFTTPTDDTTQGGFAFNKFVLRLPGEDKILGNEDDWIGYDGMLVRWSDVAKGAAGRSVSAGALEP
jgi:hypothetical protein